MIGDTVRSGVVMSIAAQQVKQNAAGLDEASLRRLLDLSVHRRNARESSGRTPEQDRTLLDTTLNAMPTHVALLDGVGRIIVVNKAWRYFAAALDQPLADDLVGVEYLKSGILGALTRRHALFLRVTLKAMLRGEVERFQQVIRTVNTDRWYQVSVARFDTDGAVRIVVTHEDISAIHAAQDTIKSLSRRLLDLQEEERQRIAVDLHDSTAQQLTAIGLGLMSLRGRSAKDAETQQLFDDVEHLVAETQKEIRTFSYLLHPPYLERDGLKMTLLRFIDGYRRRTGLNTTAQVAADVDNFAPDVQRALLRIVQEALANVHRHASATEVLVKLKTTKTTLMFNITDNGRGMNDFDHGDVASSRAFGLGLPGMHARVTLLGGTLKILSGMHGTTVFGKVPLVQRTAPG
jgi:signal transduction histidine kinase